MVLFYQKTLNAYLTSNNVTVRSVTSNNVYNLIGITSTRAMEVYKIEPIATFLDHQCVNVVERILKDPTHPITQKQTDKSHDNTKSSQHIPATARTKTYQNSCLQKAIRIKRG
jgi:hypothetical protein